MPTPGLFAPPQPENRVTFPRHPCPGADPHTPRARSTSSPRLRCFSPPIRLDPAISTPVLNHTHIRATLVQARDRPRGPRTLPPSGICPQASAESSKTGHRSLSCSATRRDTCAPNCPRRHYGLARERRRPQLRNGQNGAESSRICGSDGVWGARQCETGSVSNPGWGCADSG